LLLSCTPSRTARSRWLSVESPGLKIARAGCIVVVEQRVVDAAMTTEERQARFRRIGIPILIALGAFLAGAGFGKLDNAALDSVRRIALWIQVVASGVGVIFLISFVCLIETRQSG
jgi:hypothetical protein